MLTYILRRVLQLIPVMIGVTIVSFSLMRLAPGDPAQLLAETGADQSVIEGIRARYGLNEPLYVQYAIYMGDLVRGDFGRSLFTRTDIGPELWRRLGVTLKLTLFGLTIAITAGLLIGIMAARRQNSLLDSGSMVFALIGVSMPNFWLGLLLMWAFALVLPLFPAGGGTDLYSLVLPALTVGLSAIALIARMTRASMLEEIRQDYVRTARSNGAPEALIVGKHALKNAMIPIITVIGLQFGYLLGGAVITETVFGIPGIGTYLVDAIQNRDYPVVQSTMFVVAMLFVLVNLVTDIAYAYFDPRIRYQ